MPRALEHILKEIAVFAKVMQHASYASRFLQIQRHTEFRRQFGNLRQMLLDFNRCTV